MRDSFSHCFTICEFSIMTGRKKLASFTYLGIQVICCDTQGRMPEPFYAVHPLSQRTLWAETAHKMRNKIWQLAKA